MVQYWFLLITNCNMKKKMVLFIKISNDFLF